MGDLGGSFLHVPLRTTGDFLSDLTIVYCFSLIINAVPAHGGKFEN